MALDYAKAYQQFIDEELAAASATAWMIPPAGKVRFAGGKSVEISTLTTTGLGTYQSGKTDGSAFPSGTVSNVWNSYNLAMDRGVKFSLDRMDPSDTAFLVTAENVIREFSRNALVKEQDMYRIHKLYELIQGDGTFGSTHVVAAQLDKSNAIATLTGLLQTVRSDAETMDGFVALVSYPNQTHFLEAHDVDLGRGGAEGQFQQAVIVLCEAICGHVGQALIHRGGRSHGGVVGEHQGHGASGGAGHSGHSRRLKGDKDFR